MSHSFSRLELERRSHQGVPHFSPAIPATCGGLLVIALYFMVIFRMGGSLKAGVISAAIVPQAVAGYRRRNLSDRRCRIWESCRRALFRSRHSSRIAPSCSIRTPRRASSLIPAGMWTSFFRSLLKTASRSRKYG
ncbi:hypothetical protein AGR4A_Cc210086 [Agrobacterium tumefaciens str. B6]|uniref:Uncharacterized protein n=1 Tax=Agrobacterium tumefaciens str. B6 TaxID=1183423 RepID=A0A822V1E4_AGRTU|nr:hypothetical protein AGR4A_Cc210086 [Agrobacterium tumefaciens str. B6]